MSTDRPDLTESPITVDAGHIQVEADVIFYSQSKTEEAKDKGLNIAAVNFKVGLSNYADIQFVLPSYTSVTSEVRDQKTTVDGFGDLVTRLKLNLIGNDEGEFALGVMPLIKLPTASDDLGNDEVEFGLIFPAAMTLPDGFGAGVMIELDYLMDVAEDERFTSLVLSGTIGRDLSDVVGAFVEIVGEKSSLDGAKWQSIFSTGMTYSVNDNLQFDAGVFAGLTDEVDDLAMFCGVSFRR
jgi:hypothetical protein